MTLQDIFYHFIAALFYLSASLLEGSVASTMEYDLLYEHYLENVFAAVSSPVNLLVLTAPTTH